MCEIFTDEDFAKAHRRDKIKLQTRGIRAETVVDEVGQNQRGVSGVERKRQVGGVAEQTSSAVCFSRREPENQEHDHGHHQRKQSGTAARKIMYFFFEYCGNRAGDAGDVPA